MANLAGDMVAAGSAPGVDWVAADGRYYLLAYVPDIRKRFGSRWTPTIPNHVKLPTSRGYYVCLRDTAATSESATATILSPPHVLGEPSNVSIETPPDGLAADGVDVACHWAPGVPLEACARVDGVNGTFVGLTATENTEDYTGHVDAEAGEAVIRVRPVAATGDYRDSAAFTLS